LQAYAASPAARIARRSLTHGVAAGLPTDLPDGRPGKHTIDPQLCSPSGAYLPPICLLSAAIGIESTSFSAVGFDERRLA
jgi:hypothetical protein